MLFGRAQKRFLKKDFHDMVRSITPLSLDMLDQDYHLATIPRTALSLHHLNIPPLPVRHHLLPTPFVIAYLHLALYRHHLVVLQTSSQAARSLTMFLILRQLRALEFAQ